MFSYRPPKGSCWGNAIHPRNPLLAIRKMHAFFEKYFGPVEPEGNITINLIANGDKENQVPKLREKASELFGNQGYAERTDWDLAPTEYYKAINFILENCPSSKPSGDLVWLSFSCSLKWKEAALPHIKWPEEFLEPDMEKFQQSLFMAKFTQGGRVVFPMGLIFPLSITDSASYDFLRMFSADAPFKMSPKQFQVLIPIGKNGKSALRKPDANVLEKLNEVIGHG